MAEGAEGEEGTEDDLEEGAATGGRPVGMPSKYHRVIAARGGVAQDYGAAQGGEPLTGELGGDLGTEGESSEGDEDSENEAVGALDKS